MALIGLALGAPLGAAIGGAAEYVAIGVLLAFGFYTLLSPERDEETRLGQLTHAHGMGAVVLGVSTASMSSRSGSHSVCCASPPRWSLSSSRSSASCLREGAERLAGVALTGLGIWLLAEKLLA